MATLKLNNKKACIDFVLNNLLIDPKDIIKERSYAERLWKEQKELFRLARRVKLSDDEKFNSLSVFFFEGKDSAYQKLKKLNNLVDNLVLPSKKEYVLGEKVGSDFKIHAKNKQTIHNFIYGKEN